MGSVNLLTLVFGIAVFTPSVWPRAFLLCEDLLATLTPGKNHINGIENFWNQAKRVLRKYSGTPKKSFPLFLKECEFRFLSFGPD